MSQDDVTQIRVGNSSVGVIGLKPVIEDMAPGYAEKADAEVGDELLARLSKKNYIPPTVQEEYRQAFLREFKKFLGKPVEAEAPQGLEVKVLGPGCSQCDRLEQDLMAVMSETGIVADVQHIRDVKEIGTYGVMGTPALIINNTVKAVGKVPPKNKLKQWLEEAQG
ncbi:MAG: thioredoxin family protein [Deltaproteobacteria bacterium]|nr:thioredoxin family protein [Deltaproteobacteria bacterium]